MTLSGPWGGLKSGTHPRTPDLNQYSSINVVQVNSRSLYIIDRRTVVEDGMPCSKRDGKLSRGSVRGKYIRGNTSRGMPGSPFECGCRTSTRRLVSTRYVDFLIRIRLWRHSWCGPIADGFQLLLLLWLIKNITPVMYTVARQVDCPHL